ncbi:MAG: CHASE2 domain-containing protein [Planctomycetes bacterium]|nr:CHASE2 domain-containing protein [Planctomycetota bacterium]
MRKSVSHWRGERAAAILGGVGGSAAAFALGILLLGSDPGRRLENGCLDLAFRRLGPVSRPPEDVVQIVIDSSSLLAMRSFYRVDAGDGGEGPAAAREEAWPWRRTIYAALADFLHQAGARALLVDLDLSGASALDEYEDVSQTAAEVLRRAPIAYLAINFKRPSAEGAEALAEGSHLAALWLRSEEVLRRSAVEVRGASRFRLEEGEYTTAQVPFGPLGEAGVARRLGFVNTTADDGDVCRRVPLLIRHGGHLVPSLPLAAALDLLGVEQAAIDERGRLLLDDGAIPLDEQGRLIVNWYGPHLAFPSFPAHLAIKAALADYERRVARGDVDDPLLWDYLGWADEISEEDVAAQKERFRGRTVLLGANAPELGDTYATPYSAVYPGVEVHATVLANLLTGEALRRPPIAVRLSILLALSLAAGLGAALAGGERRSLIVFAVLVIAYALVFAGMFRARIWLDLAAPLAAAALAYSLATLVQYFTAGRLKRRLRAAFEHVLQPALVDHLLEDPRRLLLGGEVRDLTVLFTDLESSTSLAERLPPGEWIDRLNRYFSECTALVIDRRGYLDKYIGDGIMAVWGAPAATADHAEQACLAAVDLRTRLDRLESEIAGEHSIPLRTRIGINSGEMVVGMVGGEGLAHYTALGDNVVIASRLEGACKTYGARILIGETTYEKAKDVIAAREIDRVVLKGKRKAIRIHEILGRRGEIDDRARRRIDLYSRALALYRERRWEEARAQLDELLQADPEDGPARVLKARCEGLRARDPGPGWCADFEMTGK